MLSADMAMSLKRVAAVKAPEMAQEDDDKAIEELHLAARADHAYTRLAICLPSGFPKNRYDHNTLENME